MRARVPEGAGGVTAGGGGEGDGLLRCALHWQLSNAKHATSTTTSLKIVLLGLQEEH